MTTIADGLNEVKTAHKIMGLWLLAKWSWPKAVELAVVNVIRQRFVMHESMCWWKREAFQWKMYG